MPQFDPPTANSRSIIVDMPDEDVTAVGVDGCRDGWTVAAVTDRAVSWTFVPSLTAIGSRFPGAVIGIDVPIGLAAEGERRPADLAARTFLGPARASIFFTPSRSILELWRTDQRHPLGQSVSRQTWNIIAKISEVDAALAADRSLRERVSEVHPECSFRAMAGATVADPHPAESLLASKKTGRGVGQRLRLLRDRAGFILPDLLDAPPEPALDDLLDAAAAAWTAQRWRAGSASLIRFGTPAQGQILV